MLPESLVTNPSDFTLDACLIKSGTLSDAIDQLFPNLQSLNSQERKEGLRIFVDKFPPNTAQSAAEPICSPRSESLARQDQRPGPESKAVRNDGSEHLVHAGREATAKFLSSPKSEREFRSVRDLAKYAGVTPKTIYLWMKDPVILRRAQSLTVHRKALGDLTGRREWPRIMRAQVKKALAGDTAAAKFVDKRAWPEDRHTEASSAISILSARELFDDLADSQVAPSEMLPDGVFED